MSPPLARAKRGSLPPGGMADSAMGAPEWLRFLVLALALAGAGAARGEWKTIVDATDSAPAMAYDVKRTRYEPPYLTTWTRVVPAAPGKLADGTHYRSVLQKVAVDCGARTWAVTYSEFHAGRDAAGAPVYFSSVPRDDWELRPARPDSNGARLVKELCATPKPW